MAPLPRSIWLFYCYRPQTMWNLSLAIHPFKRVLGTPSNLYSPCWAPYQSRSQFAPLIRVIYKTPLLHTHHQCNRISFPSAPAPAAPLQCRASTPATFCFLLSLPCHYGGRSMPVSQACYGIFHSLILCLKMWELLATKALF